MNRYQQDVWYDESACKSPSRADHQFLQENGYMGFVKQDSSGISVSPWRHVSVLQHRHLYYELQYVTKGRCLHHYKGVEAALIPGDVFLVAPHDEHSYNSQQPLELINLQFYPDGLGEEFHHILQSICRGDDVRYYEQTMGMDYEEILINISAPPDEGEEHRPETLQDNLNKQGVLHLEMEERAAFEELLYQMMEEYGRREEHFEFMKSLYLKMLFVFLERVKKVRRRKANRYQGSKKDQIHQILSYIETHLEEPLDLGTLARQSYWSEGYFRSIFKDVTGLSPVEYINRLRIVKSLEYMEKEHLNISEAAERVGICDPSYYSRLFKKIMGYSPRYFKGIKV